MTFRGSMPPAQPFHGQPPHPQAYLQYSPTPQQQSQQHLQGPQHHDAQRYAGDGGGGGAVGYQHQQQFYEGHPPQYLHQQPQHQQPNQRPAQAQHTVHSAEYAAQGMSQFPGYDAMGYNPYMQQPAAAQYMPPPNVWQQQQQQQQQAQAHQQHPQHMHRQLHQQMQQVNQQRMEPMRVSPVQRFDQLPPQQQQQHHAHQHPQAHQAQHHPQHYPQNPQHQQPQQPSQQQPQHHAQFHPQPSQSPSPSPRFPSQMVPQQLPPSHHSMASPSAQHMPQPQRPPQPQYRPSPTQPSPQVVPTPPPMKKKKTPVPSPRGTPQQHPTPPPATQTQAPATSGRSQKPVPKQTPVPLPKPAQPSQPATPQQPVQTIAPSHLQPQPQPQQPPPPQQQPQPEAQAEPDVTLQEPDFASMQFVNLQDIQQLPPLPSLPFENLSSLNNSQKKAEPIVDEPMAVDPAQLQGVKESPVVKTKQEPSDSVQIKASPHSSVAPSPALSSRSLSISKKSPSVSSKSRPGQSTQMLIAVAEEMLSKARAAVHDVAMSLQNERVEEYQTLISISVGCLESALHSGRLTPRQEARLRLRYATVLHEETDNVMECETALTKGISLCDNYLLMRVLFQRSRKAALRALDNHIADCETFKHINWYYAFRLLKATLCMEAGTASDASALENLRALQAAAAARGDNALCVFASLMEGITFLKAAKEGANEKVQACLAQVAKYQLDESVSIPQIEILTLLLDVASSINTYTPEVTAEKLRHLQKRFDECTQWGDVNSEFLIAIRKSSTSGKTVSNDTSVVLRSNENDASSDYLVMTFMTRVELTSLIFTIGGLANFLRQDKDGHKTMGFWQEGLKILEGWDDTTAGIPYGAQVSLPMAIRQRQWRIDSQCYLTCVLGMRAASRCQWDATKQHLTKLEQLSTPGRQSTLDLFVRYLTGVYLQGTGDLLGALSVFRDGVFKLPDNPSAVHTPRCEFSLLAALNRLWIMQHPSCRNDEETLQLVEDIRPLCTNHPHINLRSTWHAVMAALVTDPPQSLSSRKQNMASVNGGTRTTSNVFLSAVCLCLMRHYFFEDVLGPQAVKSARAAAMQAQRSGNLLWESVADGMLAQTFETEGLREDARGEREKAVEKAAAAFARS